MLQAEYPSDLNEGEAASNHSGNFSFTVNPTITSTVRIEKDLKRKEFLAGFTPLPSSVTIQNRRKHFCCTNPFLPGNTSWTRHRAHTVLLHNKGLSAWFQQDFRFQFDLQIKWDICVFIDLSRLSSSSVAMLPVTWWVCYCNQKKRWIKLPI